MSITPQLKAMVEAREEEVRRETVRQLSEGKEAERVRRVMAAIDRAAPRLDEINRGPNRWRPSELLKIRYFLVATSNTTGADQRAAELVHAALNQGASDA